MASDKPARRWIPRFGAAPTDREMQVLRLLADGLLDREIAVELGIGTGAVALHRAHLCAKTGMRNRVELARYAIAHGHVPVAWMREPSASRNTSIAKD